VGEYLLDPLPDAVNSCTSTAGLKLTGPNALGQGAATNHPNKAFITLRAQFALIGHTLHWTGGTTGYLAFYATRLGKMRYLPTLDAAGAFLDRIGGLRG
jgi:hypothetical protein